MITSRARSIGRRLLLALSGASVAAAPNTDEIPDSVSVPQFTAIPSLSTDLVFINYWGYRLEIPRNYLYHAYMATNYKEERNPLQLFLRTAFPNMTGATTSDLMVYTGLLWAATNLIEVRFLSNYAAGADLYQDQQIQIARAKPESRDTNGLVAVGTSGIDATLVDLSKGDERDIVISVLDMGDGSNTRPVRRCRVNFQLRQGLKSKYPGIGIQYEYDSSLLPRAREVDGSVRALLNGFVKGPVR